MEGTLPAAPHRTSRLPAAIASALPALGLLAGLLLVFECSPIVTSTDSRWAVSIARSIVRDGDTDLSELRQQIEESGASRNWVLEIDGQMQSYFPIGAPLLATPLVALHDRVFGIEAEQDAEKRSASFLSALAAVAFYVLARRQISVPGALALALVFALGTPVWSTASRGLWGHGPGILLITLAWLLLWAPTRVRSSLAGLLLAVAYVTRPTLSTSLVAFGAALAWRRRDLVPWFAAACCAGLALFVLWSRETYGQTLPPYYLSRLSVFSSTALIGLLVSPSRGLLVFSPVFALVPLGLWLAIRARRFLEWYAAAAGVLALQILVVAAFPHWWGGSSYGPRLLTDVMPHATFLLIPVVSAIESWRGPRRIALAGLFVGLAGIGIAIHARGAWSLEVWRWHEQPVALRRQPVRIWDWSDPQFLRGLHSPPDRWRAGTDPAATHRVSAPLEMMRRRLTEGTFWRSAHLVFVPGEEAEIYGLEPTERPRELEIGLDQNDSYEVELRAGEHVLCTFELGPASAAAGLHAYRIALPPACGNARTIVVRPISGDGRYSVGQVRIEVRRFAPAPPS